MSSVTLIQIPRSHQASLSINQRLNNTRRELISVQKKIIEILLKPLGQTHIPCAPKMEQAKVSVVSSSAKSADIVPKSASAKFWDKALKIDVKNEAWHATVTKLMAWVVLLPLIVVGCMKIKEYMDAAFSAKLPSLNKRVVYA